MSSGRSGGALRRLATVPSRRLTLPVLDGACIVIRVREKRPPVGDKIRSARADRGWKQKHLAAEVDVEPITVSRWERGATTPDLDVLSLVAEATGKPLSYFVEDQPMERGVRLDEAVERIEAAAARIADEAERMSQTIAELRQTLRRAG
jgi:transcriptional regulator with XRE-family HTH domain